MPHASASCVFLSLGATLSPSERAARSRRFSPSLSSSLALSFSLPLVLGRRRNPLDVSEPLVLFYQPSVVDRPECDWPSVGTVLGRSWVCAPVRSSRWPGTRQSRAACRMHTRSTRAFLTVSRTWINRVGGCVRGGIETAKNSRRRAEVHADSRTFRYPVSVVSGIRLAAPRSTGAVNGALLDTWGCPLPSYPPPHPLSLTLSHSFPPPARLHSFHRSPERDSIAAINECRSGTRATPFAGARVYTRATIRRGGGGGGPHIRRGYISNGISSEKELWATLILYFYNTRCAIPS